MLKHKAACHACCAVTAVTAAGAAANGDANGGGQRRGGGGLRRRRGRGLWLARAKGLGMALLLYPPILYGCIRTLAIAGKTQTKQTSKTTNTKKKTSLEFIKQKNIIIL